MSELRWAVHLDGALLTADIARREIPHDARLVLTLRQRERCEAVFVHSEAAAMLAKRVKRALPDAVVTIVVWFEP